MPTQVQMRRGTTVEHSAFAGANGEVTVDTTKKSLIVHDGTTPGGTPVATEALAISVRDRANHTGTQPASTISDFAEAVDERIAESGGGSGDMLKATYDPSNIAEDAFSPSNHYYTQPHTGAVLSPHIRRLNNTLFASEFGAKGDDYFRDGGAVGTNDYAALNAWLAACALTGKEGRLDSGKNYYVSGGDLTFQTKKTGRSFALYGYGSSIRNNPAENRTGLQLSWDFAGGTRNDDGRTLLVEGWTFDHYQNANARWGIRAVGLGQNLILKENHFAGGSDSGTAAYTNYGAIFLEQGTNTNPDTAIFWNEFVGNRFKGGALPLPVAFRLQGAINASNIHQNNLANCGIGVYQVAANLAGSTANDATIPNGVNVHHNWFEGVGEGIKFAGIAGVSRSVGLIVDHNRVESVGTAFFNYSGLNLDTESPPILGPNSVLSGDVSKYILNTNQLNIDVRDRFVRTASFTVSPIAANTKATLGTVTVFPAKVGDTVTVVPSSNVSAIQFSGFVSSANTVTVDAFNGYGATSGNLGSVRFRVEVSPRHF